jgi:hypothetical protein
MWVFRTKEMDMDFTQAKTIVRTLAEGIDPTTGEVFAEDSPYNNPFVIRALFTVHDLARSPKRVQMSAEERRRENLDRGRPGNAGLPWTDKDRAFVASGFEEGKPFEKMAEDLERTRGAIRAELIRQGLVSPDFH